MPVIIHIYLREHTQNETQNLYLCRRYDIQTQSFTSII